MESSPVIQRPYVLVSCAMSVDGYIDDASGTRLVLSGEADLDRVDEVRAGCDAIMVGANTIRRDNPRLRIRSAQRRADRTAVGLPEHPVRVTLTGTGNLDPAAAFFAAGGPRPLVFCARPALAVARGRLGDRAELVDAGEPPSLALLLHALSVRRIARLLLEGGGQLASEFLTAGLADELHLTVAPFFVGDPAAPRFALPGYYPHTPAAPMRLAETRPVGNVVLLRYELTPSLATTPPPPAVTPHHQPVTPHHLTPAPTPEPPHPHPAWPQPTPTPQPNWPAQPGSPDHPGSPGQPVWPPDPGSPGQAGSSPRPRPRHAAPGQPSSAGVPAPGPSWSPPAQESRLGPPPPEQDLSLPTPEPSASATPPSNLSLPPHLPRRPRTGSRTEDIRWLRETIARLNAPGQTPPPSPTLSSDSTPSSDSAPPPGQISQPGPQLAPDLLPAPGPAALPHRPGQFSDAGPGPGPELPPSFEPEWPPSATHPHRGGPAVDSEQHGQAGSGPRRRAGSGADGWPGPGPGSPADSGAGGPEDPGPAAAAQPADVDVSWLREAIELSKRCPPSQTAFSVGAIIVAADGTPLATGFSRETDPHDHAEEAALAKLSPGDPRLAMATLYSSLEPCGVRASRPRPCADLIIAAGLRRVVYAWHEPPLLAPGGGAEKLRAAGVAVIEVPQLADQARRINAHLTDPHPPRP